MRRYVAVHMLLFHGVPSVRRISKPDAATLLMRFYACRTIQRFMRGRIARSYIAAVADAPKPRDHDASMTRAMRHILACTVAAVVAPGSESAPGLDLAAYAADIERIVTRLHRLDPSTALAIRRRWVEAIGGVQKGDVRHGARLDAVVAALRKGCPKLAEK